MVTVRTPGITGPGVVLHLLGGFRLLINDREVTLSTACERLVSLLAVRGRLTRSQAAGALWPDVPEDRAKANLRTCVWRTNRAAPGVVEARGGTVQIAPAVVIDIRAEASGDHFQGELLPAIDEEWLVLERERLRQAGLRRMEDEADRLLQEGRHDEALDVAYGALAVDPSRPRALRTIMAVHRAEGNEAEVRRLHERLAHIIDLSDRHAAGR
jgi:DNA-binding SARP family transcriptional activator